MIEEHAYTLCWALLRAEEASGHDSTKKMEMVTFFIHGTDIELGELAMNTIRQ